MGTMLFPEDIEKLYNRFNGRLTERYHDEKGRMVEDLHRGRDGSPLMERRIYTGEDLDDTNRESIFFEGDTGKEIPYLRRVYEDNRLRIEEGLRGALDKLRYHENYTYRGNEGSPSTTVHEDFDENGKSLSVSIFEKGKGWTIKSKQSDILKAGQKEWKVIDGKDSRDWR